MHLVRGCAQTCSPSFPRDFIGSCRPTFPRYSFIITIPGQVAPPRCASTSIQTYSYTSFGCTLRTGSNRILEYTKMEGTSSFLSPPLRSSTVSPLAFLTTFSISLPIFSFLLSVLRIPPYVPPIVARARPLNSGEGV